MLIAILNEKTNMRAFARFWCRHIDDIEYVAKTTQTSIYDIQRNTAAKLLKSGIMCYKA